MNPEKKLKLILASLKDREITKFFQVFSAHFPNQFKKTLRQISFNCYQQICEFKTKIVSGYGKNSNEAYINSVRTLIELLADDSKMHSILKQSLRLIQQSTCTTFESQKKLIPNDKGSKNNLKTTSLHASVKPGEKKPTLKEQIFQYLNLENLKISNPNATHKTKTHEKYMSLSADEDQSQIVLSQINRKNQQLEKEIKIAREENIYLKNQLKKQQQQNQQRYEKYSKNGQPIATQTKSNLNIDNDNKRSKGQLLENSQQPLKQRTNQYTNQIQQSKQQPEKSKLRSISMQGNQKYLACKQKKMAIPKLNLQVLPNYHGKSNKSLNQSLMEVYEKTHFGK